MTASVVGSEANAPAMRLDNETPMVVIERPRRLALRHAWLVPGLAVAVYANALATDHGLGLVPLLVFGIVPHLAFLVGIGQPHAPGQLAPRAVPLFNMMHHPGLPVALLALAAVGVLPVFWLVGALAWLGHIAVDLALGDGLRTADGWRRRRRWTSR
jgi:Domain of unknown function (DUF4260)